MGRQLLFDVLGKCVVLVAVTGRVVGVASGLSHRAQ